MQLVEKSVGGRNFVVIPSYACMPMRWNKLRWFRFISNSTIVAALRQKENFPLQFALELKSKILRVDCCVEFVARIQVSYKLQKRIDILTIFFGSGNKSAFKSNTKSSNKK